LLYQSLADSLHQIPQPRRDAPEGSVNGSDKAGAGGKDWSEAEILWGAKVIPPS